MSYVNFMFTNSRNLPAKSASEEKKHRKQYEAMVAEAKKKGRKLVLIFPNQKDMTVNFNSRRKFLYYSGQQVE